MEYDFLWCPKQSFMYVGAEDAENLHAVTRGQVGLLRLQNSFDFIQGLHCVSLYTEMATIRAQNGSLGIEEGV